MDLRAAIVVVSSIVSIGGPIGGCTGDDPAVSAETSTGPSDSGTGDPSTSVDPDSSGPSSASDPTTDSSGTTAPTTDTTTEGSGSEGSSSEGTTTTDADSSSTGDASSEGSSGSSTDTGGETGVVDGCDPIAQNCADGQACYPLVDGFECFGISEAGAQGDACAFIDVCDAGLFCANAAFVEGCMDDVGCCTAFCDLSNPADPCQDISPTMFCVPWYAEGEAPAGLESVGACLAV